MSECVLWTGRTINGRYGDDRGRPAHVRAYEREKGPVPKGLVIDHLCKNQFCINVEHLEAVTQRVNVLRGKAAQPRKFACDNCGGPYEVIRVERGGKVKRGCRLCRAAYMATLYQERRASV